MKKERMKMTRKLENPYIESSLTLRAVTVDDTFKLAKTMFESYTGTVDFHEETIEEAILEVEKTFQNGYGPFIPEASFLIENEDEVCAAILINLWQDEPLVTEVFVGKAYRKQGMASALIERSMHELMKLGYEDIVLYVTLTNDNAIKLYKQLGFTPVEQ